MGIGENIGVYRQRKNMTLEQLAQKLGLTVDECRRIESGQRMLSSSEIQRICKILDVSLDALLTHEPPQDPADDEGSILMPIDELQHLLGQMKD